MHVRESKLYALAQSMAGFMGGWGRCQTGIDSIASIENDLLRGFGLRKRLDQCNLRGWLIMDVVYTLALAGLSFALGCAFGNLVFAPLLWWLTQGSTGAEQPLHVVILMVVVLHALTLCWAKGLPGRTVRPVAAYMGLWEKVIVWLFKTTVRGTSKVKVVSTGFSQIGRGLSLVAAAGREVKHGVCVTYDLVTPEVKVERAGRWLIDRHDLWHEGTVLLVTGNGGDWAAKVKAKIGQFVKTLTDLEEHVQWQVALDCNVLALSLPEALAVIANLSVENAELLPQLTILHDLDEPPAVLAEISHLLGDYNTMAMEYGDKVVHATEVLNQM